MLTPFIFLVEELIEFEKILSGICIFPILRLFIFHNIALLNQVASLNKKTFLSVLPGSPLSLLNPAHDFHLIQECLHSRHSDHHTSQRLSPRHFQTVFFWNHQPKPASEQNPSFLIRIFLKRMYSMAETDDGGRAENSFREESPDSTGQEVPPQRDAGKIFSREGKRNRKQTAAGKPAARVKRRCKRPPDTEAIPVAWQAPSGARPNRE